MENTGGMLWLLILGKCIPPWAEPAPVHQELLLLLLPDAGQRAPAD